MSEPQPETSLEPASVVVKDSDSGGTSSLVPRTLDDSRFLVKALMITKRRVRMLVAVSARTNAAARTACSAFRADGQ